MALSSSDFQLGLYDATTDELIAIIENGQLLSGNLLLSGSLTIAAIIPNTSSLAGQIGSVVLNLNGGQFTRTENVAPYALFGDINGDFFGGSNILQTGDNNILAQVFSGSGGGGTFLGDVTLSFTVTDGSNSALPVATDDAATTDKDSVVNGDVLTNDSDPDGDPLTVTTLNSVAANIGTPTALASGALVTLNADGTYSYDPNGAFDSLQGGQSASDSFTYTISDGQGGADTATVNITIDGISAPSLSLSLNPSSISENGGAATATITRPGDTSQDLSVTLTSSDTSEATVASTVTIPAGSASTTVTVQGVDDSAVDGSQPVTISASAPGFSTVTASLTVTDDDNENAPASSEFQLGLYNADTDELISIIEDGQLLSENLLTGSLTIAAIIPDGSSLEGQVGSVGLNFNNGQITRIESVAPYALFGDIAGDFSGGGNFVQTGLNSITAQVFSLSGGGGTVLDTLELNFTVTEAASNALPVATDDAATTDKDSVVNGDVLTNDSDPDGDPLTVTTLNSVAADIGTPTALASGALVTLNADGTYSYDPNGAFDSLQGGQSASDSFTYTISDGQGGADTATVNITIDGISAPSLSLSLNPSSISENGGAATATITRPGDTSQDLSVTLTSSDTSEATVASTVTIPAGSASTTVTVQGVDDSAVDGSQPVTISASAPGFSTVTASLTVTDDDNENAPASSEFQLGLYNADTDELISIIEDGQLLSENLLTGSLTIAAIIPDGSSLEGQVGSIGLNFNNGQITRIESVAPYALFGDIAGDFTGGGNFVQTGLNSITAQVFSLSGGGGTVLDTLELNFTVTEAASNALPVATDDAATTDKDSVVNGDVLTNDSDPDGDPLTVTTLNSVAANIGTPTALASGALVTLNADGTYSYDPNGAFDSLQSGQSASDSFTYTISDGQGGADTAIANIVISGDALNTPPIAGPPLADRFFEDDATPVTFDLLPEGAVTDADGDTLSVVAGSLLHTLAPATSISVDVKGTYLLTDASDPANAPTQVDLAALGIQPGDFIQLSSAGNYTVSPTTPELSTLLLGLFSGPSGFISPNPDSATVPFPIVSLPTSEEGQETDIPEDFLIVSELRAVKVPEGATTLLLSVFDDKFSDNNDSDNDFTVNIQSFDIADFTPVTSPGVVLNGNSLQLDASALDSFVGGDLDSLAAGEQASVSFAYQVTDGNGGTTDQFFSLQIFGRNDAPQIVTTPITATANEDDPNPVSIDLLPDGSITDVDGDTLSVVSGSLSPAQVFVASVPIDVTGTYLLTDATDAANPPTEIDLAALGIQAGDVLRFSATGTFATGPTAPEFNTALTAVFSGPPGHIAHGPESTVIPVFTLPTLDEQQDTDIPEDFLAYGAADADTVEVPAGATKLLFSVIDNHYSDNVDSDNNFAVNISKVISTDVPSAVLKGNALEFDPNDFNNLAAGASQDVFFTYDVTDGNGATVTQTLTLTVNGENDAPTAGDDTLTINEDEITTIFAVDLLANDSDPENDDLTVLDVLSDGLPLRTDPDGNRTFIPSQDFSGTITLTYTISDGNGGTDTGNIEVTVNPVNDAPVPGTTELSTNEDTGITDTLAATDVDGDTLTFALASDGDPANGTIDIQSDGSFTYTPNANFNGEDTFTYEVFDGTDSVSQQVTVTVGADNDAPTLTVPAAPIQTQEDTEVPLTGISVNDADGDNLTVVIAASSGTIDLTGVIAPTVATGVGTDTVTLMGEIAGINSVLANASFVPGTDENGDVTITVSVNDGGPAQTDSFTVSVAPVNDPPTISAPSLITTPENTGGTIATATATDVDSAPLTLSVAGDDGSLFLIDSVSGALSFLSPPDFEIPLDANGDNIYDIVILANDGDGGGGSVVSQVQVMDVFESVPVVNFAVEGGNFSEDSPPQSINLLPAGAVTDADGDTLSIVPGSLQQTGGQSIAFALNGNNLDFDPGNLNNLTIGESEALSFSFDVTDGSQAVTQTATVNVVGSDGTSVQVFDGQGDFVESFFTLQSAIDDALTLDGYTIRVIADNYSPSIIENVTVTKEVTIETDTNLGIDPNTGVRGTEATVASFVIDANNVVIDGFTLTGSTAFNVALQASSVSDVTFQNNIIDTGSNSSAGVIVINGTNITTVSNKIDASFSRPMIYSGSSGLVSSNVALSAADSFFDGQSNTARVAVDDNVFEREDETTSTSSIDRVVSIDDYVTFSHNQSGFTGQNLSGVVLFISDSPSNTVVENNFSFSGGQVGIFLESSGTSGSVTISESLSSFTGQNHSAIAIDPNFSGTFAIDEAALTATGGQFAKSTSVQDYSTRNHFDNGTAYFTDLQSAINNSNDLATITLSDNYSNAGAVTVGAQSLTIDAPAGTSANLTLDTGIQNITLTGDGDIDVTGNAENNRILGNDGDNTFNGANGDDRFFGNGGNDVIDGGAGNNFALYNGEAGDFTVTDLGNGQIEVTDNEPGIDGDEGTDTLTNIPLVNIIFSADSFTQAVEVRDGSDNLIATFDTIQEAIDDALTLDGYTIRVIADNYSPSIIENVTVTKEVTIETDTNLGIDPNTGVRGTEATVASFVIDANNVVIDGFTLTGSTAFNVALQASSVSDVTFQNNIIDTGSNSSAGVIVINGTNITTVSNKIDASFSRPMIYSGSSGLVSSNVALSAADSFFDGQSNTARVAVDDNVFEREDETTSTSSIDRVVSIDDYVTFSHNQSGFTGQNLSGVVLFISDSPSNTVVENNFSFSGGQVGIFLESSGTSGSVTISESLSSFTGQNHSAIAIDPNFSGTFAIDEAALTATGGQFAKSTSVQDYSTRNHFDNGTAYFTDLQSAINNSNDLATITLSDNYSNAGAVTVGAQSLTIDAPAGTSANLTLDTGIQNITLTGDGDIDVTGNAENNRILGNDGDNTFNGANGDDRFFGNGGNDVIDGGAGNNFALYNGEAGDFTVTDLGNGQIEVTDNEPGIDGDEGTDTLTNIPLVNIIFSADSFTQAVEVRDGSDNLIATFDTIQEAIDDALTLDGYTIRVIADNYSPSIIENVTVTKEVTIETDTNLGIDPNTGVRGTEATVASFVIDANNVVIDGFTLTGSTAFNVALQASSVSDVTFQNNIIDTGSNSSAGVIVINGTNITTVSNKIDASFSRPMIYSGSSGLVSSNVALSAADSFFDGQSNTARVAVDDNVFEREDETTSTSSIDRVVSIDDYVTFSHNQSGFTGQNLSGVVLFISDSPSNTVVENNFSFSGGQVGIFLESSGTSGSVTISESLSSFTGQNHSAIAIDPNFSGTFAIDEAALTATGGQFAKSTSVQDYSTRNHFDNGTAYFTDLQSAINNSNDLATITLSDNYSNAGAVTVGAQSLTIDAPAGTSANLTLDTGIQNITLTGDGDIDVTGNAENNRILGNDGGNILSGGDGNDDLRGFAGNDTLIGGPGNDTLLGGDDSDTIDYSSATGAIIANLSSSSQTVTLPDTTQVTTVANKVTELGTAVTEDELLDIENVIGSGFDDFLFGGDADNTVTGGNGDDLFIIGLVGGDDVITDFSAGAGTEDQLDLTAYFADAATALAAATDDGSDVVFTLTVDDSLTLTNVLKADLDTDDFFV